MSGWASITSTDLLVSLRVPVGWYLTRTEPDLLEVQAPEVGGYSTTLTVQAGVAERADQAWFDEFATNVAAHVVDQMPEVELLDAARFRLSSPGAEVVLVHVRQPTQAATPGMPATTQVQAWVWNGVERMLVLGGSTASSRAADDLPLLDATIRSLRLLPAPD